MQRRSTEASGLTAQRARLIYKTLCDSATLRLRVFVLETPPRSLLEIRLKLLGQPRQEFDLLEPT